MAVHPQDPDRFDEPARGTGPDGETPEADAAEQRAEVESAGTGDDDTPQGERQGTEADPADAAEQARVVEESEDEYR
ncbi:hypothetical protein [Streptomyces sp. MAR4 CNX-425]|uniref:hypothetical protein n=1 Tax=Streptomyces sp. MAR4 CNX-425 TaxID=3406343 RepID=UPI003B50CB7C